MLVGPSPDAEVRTDRVPLMIPMIRSSPGGKGWELVYPRSLDGHVFAAGRSRTLRECAADSTARADGDLAVFPLPDGARGGIELGPVLVRFREIPDADSATVPPSPADETAPTAAGIAVVAVLFVVLALLSPRPGSSDRAIEIAAASPAPSSTTAGIGVAGSPRPRETPSASATETAVAIGSAAPNVTATATPDSSAVAIAATPTPTPTTRPAATPIERDPLTLAVGTPKVRPSATPARTPKPSGFLADAGALEDEQKRFEDRLGAVPTMTPFSLEGGEGGVNGSLGSGATSGGGGGTVRDGGKAVVGRVDVSAAGSGDVKVASAGKVETPVEARMSTDVPKVTGTIDPERVQSVVQEAAGGFRRCYEAALLRNTRLAGKIVLTWRIVEDGAVEEVATGSSTLRDEEIERCLTTRVRALRFPRPDGGTVNVEFPMVFYPAIDPT